MPTSLQDAISQGGGSFADILGQGSFVFKTVYGALPVTSSYQTILNTNEKGVLSMISPGGGGGSGTALDFRITLDNTTTLIINGGSYTFYLYEEGIGPLFFRNNCLVEVRLSSGTWSGNGSVSYYGEQ